MTGVRGVGMPFAARWLLDAGVADRDIPEQVARARARGRRYPWPVGPFWAVLVALVDWVGPLLVLGRFSRAHRLSEGDFDRLLSALRDHRIPILRGIVAALVMPMMEVLTEEASPRRGVHPLDARLAAQDLDRDTFDVIVIGTGAGGAPVAWELSQAGHRVALIDKGGLVRPTTAPRAIEEHYVSQAMLGAIEGGLTLVMAGQSVGGTTSINSGTCLRPLRECLQGWDAAAGTSFGGGALDPYLDRVEEQIGVTVPPRELLSKSAAVFDRGLRALGRDDAYVLPRNAPNCVGSGRCCFGCPAQAKRSTDHAYLPSALDHGAVLFAGATATRIREEADGVQVEIRDAQGTRVLFGRHLVLAAGALYTPGLLRRNRLGTHWRRAGRGFKTHPATKVFAYFPGLEHGEKGVPQGLGYKPPELPRITMEGIHTPKSVVAPILAVAGSRLRWWLDHVHDSATFGLMIRDRNTGRVFEVAGAPQIRYRLHADDARDMGQGLLLIAEAFFAAGAERVLFPITGDNEVTSADDLRRFRPEDFTAKRMVVSGFHPQGTAGIGRVVDTDLRLYGSARISVCDASVLPDSPGVNPQVTLMALSLRLAERLAAELPSRQPVAARAEEPTRRAAS